MFSSYSNMRIKTTWRTTGLSPFCFHSSKSWSAIASQPALENILASVQHVITYNDMKVRRRSTRTNIKSNPLSLDLGLTMKRPSVSKWWKDIYIFSYSLFGLSGWLQEATDGFWLSWHWTSGLAKEIQHALKAVSRPVHSLLLRSRNNIAKFFSLPSGEISLPPYIACCHIAVTVTKPHWQRFSYRFTLI